MKKLRVLQVGIGHDHAKPNFDCLASMTEEIQLLGFVRVSGEEGIKPDFNKGFPHIPELTAEEARALPDLDAVVVETEDLKLVPYARMAAEAGLNVFMDKPGSQSVEDFEELLSLIRQHRKVFGIGYVYRFHPLVLEALERVRAGEIGTVYSVEAHMSRDDKEEKRKWLGNFRGGMTFFLGCHLIDLIHLFLGEPEEIIPLNASTDPEGRGTQDLGMAAFRYPNGISYYKACGAEPGGFLRRQLVICGSEGTLEIRPLERHCKEDHYYCVSELYSALRDQRGTPLSWDAEWERKSAPPFHRYRAMFQGFADKIRSGSGSSKEELEREASVHRMLLGACGIPCDHVPPFRLPPQEDFPLENTNLSNKNL